MPRPLGCAVCGRPIPAAALHVLIGGGVVCQACAGTHEAHALTGCPVGWHDGWDHGRGPLPTAGPLSLSCPRRHPQAVPLVLPIPRAPLGSSPAPREAPPRAPPPPTPGTPPPPSPAPRPRTKETA